MFKELQLYGEAQAVVQVNASQESEFVIAQKPETIELLWRPPLLHCSPPVPMTENGHYTGWNAGWPPMTASLSLGLQALNTGHGGSLTTVHANNAESALSRIASCAMQGGGSLPWEVTCRGVVDGIAMVIHMTRHEGRRFAEEAVFVKGYEARNNQWDIQRITVEGA